jgi:hypothetical protein
LFDQILGGENALVPLSRLGQASIEILVRVLGTIYKVERQALTHLEQTNKPPNDHYRIDLREWDHPISQSMTHNRI